MQLFDTDTIKAALTQAKKEGVESISDFLVENRDRLLGLPLDAVRDVIGASGADDTFADMQVSLYKAMGPEERSEYERQALVHMKKSREQVTRLMVLLRDASERLDEVGRNLLTGVFNVILGVVA